MALTSPEVSVLQRGETTMPHRSWPFLVLALTAVLMACSSTPPTSESDQSFTDARNNFKSSDFKAALRNLDKVIKSTSDESQRQQAIAKPAVPDDL
jgi:hypothetical protein